MMEAEADLQSELQEVRVSVTYINHNIWYYRMLFFLVCRKAISMKIVSWPCIAELNFKVI